MLEEYLDNAWISISGPVILVHAYAFVTSPTLQDMESLVEYADIIRWSSTILRLANDLGTSSVCKQALFKRNLFFNCHN